MNSEMEEISKEEFEDLINLEFHKALFLLRVFYKKMLEIIEVFCSKGLCVFRDENLNFFYTCLKNIVNSILELKGFENLKKERPELFENLIGKIEEADLDWKYGYSEQAYNFLGKIEELYILSGSKSFKLPQELIIFLEKCDKAMELHLEEKRKWEKGLIKKIQTIKKQFPELFEKQQKEVSNKEGGGKEGFEDFKKIGGKEKEQKAKKRIKEMVLYFTLDGDLYREPKEKFCFRMKKDGRLYKIIRFFVEKQIYSYYFTPEIAWELGQSDINLRKNIVTINQRVQSKLHIKGKIIEGRKGSGYRLNPKYKIVLKKE